MYYIRKILSNNLSPAVQNFNSWKTNRKIVVIESDDWGTIRMPNKTVYDRTMKFGVDVSKCPFNTFDTLANTNDLEKLFNVLKNYKDKNNNHPVITANTIVANPDFKKIRESEFSNYYYEPFTETLKRYYPNENVFSLWNQGIKEKIFFPQLHGREHLYVVLWMKFLKNNSRETRFAFDNEFFGISTTISKEERTSFLPAFDLYGLSELGNQREIIVDAQRIFNDIFSYQSKSFIAPNYTWNRMIEPYLNKCGIEILQGSRIQQNPEGGRIIKKIKHRTGDFNVNNQVYLVRNVQFEPSIYKNINWIKTVINQVENSFYWKTPAIISSHRLNFIGGLNVNNRMDNLRIFDEILQKIVKRWPDVEFMTSVQLGDLIINKRING